MLKTPIAVLLLLLLAFSLQAQEDSGDAQKRPPKVGLVLSGGGAKGLAHIGVLKEIERAGIQIDYIGGTSMGAIIGGLYASGYTAAQLDSIFEVIDFNTLIQDDLPRNSKSFYEKAEAERYALTLPFNNFKLSFPSALSKGQNFYNLFSQLTEHVKDVEDFTQLPIPFFCVATDVEKGTAVILDKGHLPQAIAASGALPSLFNPVVVDGRVLIDGGVVNNYPVEELRARGAEYIIGVDVQDSLRGKKNLTSAPDILIQINNYRTIAAMRGKIEKTNIFIRPDIDDYTVVDFDRGKEIINGGEKKAAAFRPALDSLAALQKNFYTKPKLDTKTSASLYIKSVGITGNTYYTRSYVLGKLKIRPPMGMTHIQFFNAINSLAATGNFERINHRLEAYDDGTFHLDLNVVESKVTTVVRASLHYDDLYKSAALGNITKKRLLFRNDVASLDLILGDNLRYEFDYYSDNGFYVSFGLKSSFNGFDKRVNARFVEQIAEVPLEAFNNVNVSYGDFTNQFYLRTLFEKRFSLDLGVEHKLLRIETENIRQARDEEPKLYFENSNFISTYGKLHLDSFDDKYFPKSGWFFDGDFHLYLYSTDFNDNFEQFSVGRAAVKYATSITPQFSVLTGIEGGFKIGGERLNSLDFYLGGWGNTFINNIVPFYGYDFISAGGDGLVKASITLDYEFWGKNHFNLGANVANVENKLFSSGNWLSTPDYTGYFVGYGRESFLGPLQAKFSYSPETKKGFLNFSLGFWF